MNLSRRNALKIPAALALGGGLAAIEEVRADEAAKSGELPSGEFYVDVDDFRMYCKVEGEGPLLIHQTGIWTFSSVALLAPMNEAFAKHFTVLTMDCRGQGASTLGSGPTTYTRCAADTTRMMDELGIDDAHFFGVSDGGCIQLHLLLEFEDRVRSSTLCGTPYSHDAYTPEIQASFNKWHEAMLDDSDDFYGLSETPHTPEMLEAMRAQYAAVSPEPENFMKVLRGQRRSWSTEPDVSLRRLTAVQRPVLVINTAADEYIPKKAFDDLENAIPGSESVYFDDMKHMPLTHADQITEAMVKFTRTVDAG